MFDERLMASMTPRMPVAKWVLVSLFAALCLFSLAQGLWIVKKGSDSLSWSATEGTIGLSRVETRTFRHRVTEPYKRYYPDLLYTYEVQGQQHTGMQIYATPSFMIFGYAIGENPGSTQIESVEATLARYPVGRKSWFTMIPITRRFPSWSLAPRREQRSILPGLS